MNGCLFLTCLLSGTQLCVLSFSYSISLRYRVLSMCLDSAVGMALVSPTGRFQQVNTALCEMLGYGARMPKELMLFVKDLLFLDGA